MVKQMRKRTNMEIKAVYSRQADTVYRLCFSFMKNEWDTEDAVQTTFLKLITSGKTFENHEHEKAWLIVTASNTCKNLLKHPQRKMADIDSLSLESRDAVSLDETLEAILALPERYKTTLYLYYYEGYPTKQIAAMLRRPASTIRNHLRVARILLRQQITEEIHEE